MPAHKTSSTMLLAMNMTSRSFLSQELARTGIKQTAPFFSREEEAAELSII
jgi:hypothetical protein